MGYLITRITRILRDKELNIMNTQLEELAAMVLDMRARQQELYRLEKSRRYKLNLDAEEMARLDYELRELQREVEDECRYILGIEEE